MHEGLLRLVWLWYAQEHGALLVRRWACVLQTDTWDPWLHLTVALLAVCLAVVEHPGVFPLLRWAGWIAYWLESYFGKIVLVEATISLLVRLEGTVPWELLGVIHS